MSAEKTMDEKQGRRRRRRHEPEDEEQMNEAAEAELDDVEEDDDDLDDERGITERKGRATPGRRTLATVDAPTGNIVVRTWRGMSEYLEGVRSEIAKVAWPNREDTIRLTRIVLGTTVASALILGAIAFLFTELFKIGLESPVIFVVIIVGAVGAAVYFIRTGNKGTSGY
jgi:preprotein translocase SecE subunit